MSELSDEASEPELLNRSLSMWHGLGAQVSREELAVPLDLHTAASIGQYEVVKECVQRRELDLNKKNGGGWTPLMYASYIGHDTIVHLLLEAGVNVNVPTPEGQTPLMLASSCGNESIAYFLLQQGAELEMKDIQGWTALFHCTSAGHQQMVKFLLDSGANANVREPVYGFTPLMEAAAAGHEIIVQYFLNHGVRVDTRDHSGATARMLAKQYGHMKIVGLIDAHSPSLPKNLYRSPEKFEDLSSSDESCPVPQRQKLYRKKGLSIHEGPRALARITAIGLGGKIQQPCCVMSELSDEASEPELLNRSLSMWHGLGAQVSREELAVPLDLHTAASIGQYEVVKECVQRRELDLNKKNGGGWTPLMYASYIGHDTIVHLLLEAGVNVNVPTPEGQTPLMLASSCGNESIAYFLLQQGAELEMKDIQGWTALFHCTSAGHQQMVKFLLDSGANANVREPVYGFTPLMEAAAAGHEIIVQYFLNHGVRVDTRDHSGATARMLAKQYGHMKIVGLIDAHSPSLPKNLYRSPEKFEDLSSSDESCPVPQRQKLYRKKGLSIHEGPRALARITAIGLGGKIQQPCCEQVPPQGYVTFHSSDENPLDVGGLCYRDVTSPINDRDGDSSSSSSREEHAFCANLGAVRRSSSSEGLMRAPGVSSEASLESNEDSDHACKSSVRKQTKSYMKTKNRYSNSDNQWPTSTGTSGAACSPGCIPQTERAPYSGPQDLATLLEQIGCLKYLQLFEEQDVDLRIFLTLTESDLKEIGITLFGPKRKMTSAIARWHSSARPPSDALELAYADRLEAEMQELAIQLHKRCEEVEAMRGQVSQEQELRAVVETCLLEQDGAREDVRAQLQETWALAQDAALILDQLRACQAELSARVKQEVSTRGLPLAAALPTADSKGWQASLQALSLPELSGTLEDRVQEMGRVLCSVTQSLEKLQVLNGKENWREP